MNEKKKTNKEKHKSYLTDQGVGAVNGGFHSSRTYLCWLKRGAFISSRSKRHIRRIFQFKREKCPVLFVFVAQTVNKMSIPGSGILCGWRSWAGQATNIPHAATPEALFVCMELLCGRLY